MNFVTSTHPFASILRWLFSITHCLQVLAFSRLKERVSIFSNTRSIAVQAELASRFCTVGGVSLFLAELACVDWKSLRGGAGHSARFCPWVTFLVSPRPVDAARARMLGGCGVSGVQAGGVQLNLKEMRRAKSYCKVSQKDLSKPSEDHPLASDFVSIDEMKREASNACVYSALILGADFLRAAR